MPGVGLHGRRIAPVGAHDERVRAARQAHPGLEGQVGPGVARGEVPVDPDGGLVVDGLEADRVEARARHDDRRAIPRHRARERALAGDPAHVTGVRRERHRLLAPGEMAVAPAQRRAAPGVVAPHDPRAVEHPRAGRSGDRRQRRSRPPLLADGASHQGESRHHGRQAGGHHPPSRGAHQSRVSTWRAGSARARTMRMDGVLTTLLTPASGRRLRPRGREGGTIHADDSRRPAAPTGRLAVVLDAHRAEIEPIYLAHRVGLLSPRLGDP
jgi:hypothetical protein